MARFQRASDPDRSGQVLLRDGEPLGLVFWSHDFADRSRTGWFLELLDGRGEGDGARPRRLTVAAAITDLARDAALPRAEWLARAEAVELTTAQAALTVAEDVLEETLGRNA